MVATGSTPGGSGASASRLASVQQGIDEVAETVRENMAMMVERESRLHELEDKSGMPQSTSGTFRDRARMLQWQLRWQRYRIIAMACAFVLWLALLHVLRDHLPAYFVATGATL